MCMHLIARLNFTARLCPVQNHLARLRFEQKKKKNSKKTKQKKLNFEKIEKIKKIAKKQKKN